MVNNVFIKWVEKIQTTGYQRKKLKSKEEKRVNRKKRERREKLKKIKNEGKRK